MSIFIEWEENDPYMPGRMIHKWKALPLTCDFIYTTQEPPDNYYFRSVMNE